MINGLTQTLLKIASPGIPDFYQGSELWDLRLVDPDNRQPVDFDKRNAMLANLPQTDEAALTSLSDLAHNWHDGRLKLYLICKALHFRAENTTLFSEGQFLTLECRGRSRDHVAAFARRYKKEWIIVVVPRWLARAGHPMNSEGSEPFWGNTEVTLPKTAPTLYKNVFTGEIFNTDGTGKARLHLSGLLKHFPVAMLSGTTSSTRAKKSESG
jgi:(1->4)-alpha-D-glucan 1-alpha-D-glucosylmutase